MVTRTIAFESFAIVLLLGGCVQDPPEPAQGRVGFVDGSGSGTPAPEGDVSGADTGGLQVPGSDASSADPTSGATASDASPSDTPAAGSGSEPTGGDASPPDSGAAGSGSPGDDGSPGEPLTPPDDSPAEPTDPAGEPDPGGEPLPGDESSTNPVAEPPSDGPSEGTLTVELTTVTQRGRYAPRNVGAVWIETGDGAFVKTLERWAGIRAGHLHRWEDASGGWGASFFGIQLGDPSPDQMDAVSRATLRTHEAHELMWNMHDADGNLVPDGQYKVVVEMTETNSAGDWAEVEFTKGPMAFSLDPPDQVPWTGMTLSYQP